MQPEHEITLVSDTALLTAACRALETERPDGLIRDPFAARLAGDRGMGIFKGLNGGERMCFGIAIRSRFLDRLVTETVEAHAIQTVLCLGAGLDSRPWRLPLPAELRWVEVDLRPVLDYKDSILGDVAPNCRRKTLVADVTDPAGRGLIFAEAQGPTLVITEGLLMYLSASAIAALAATNAAQFWLLEATSTALMRNVGAYSQSIQNVRAEDHLEGGEILDVMSRNGWIGMRHLNYSTDLMAVASERVFSMFRDLPADQIPKPQPTGDVSGVHLLGKVG